jgi:hypothetical protein
MTVNQIVAPTVSIAASPGNSICAGEQVTFSATITNGGTTPVYQWKVNGNNGGTNSSSFSSTTLAQGDVVTCQLTSNVNCPSPNPVTSTGITMTVIALPANPANPTSNSPQCASVGVTLTRNGTPPAGQTWYWQTSPTGTSTTNSGSTFTAAASGTYYIASRTTTNGCWSAGAGSVTVVVNANPTVTPTATAATICAGQSSTLAANATAGSGTISTYAWSANASLGNVSGGAVSPTPMPPTRSL